MLSENRDVIEILKQITVFLQLKGENTFKVKAYSNAAEKLEQEFRSVHVLVQEKELEKISGMGTAMVSKITEWVETGKMSFYENLKKEFPEGIEDLLKVPGLGPAKVRILFNEKQIASLEDLKTAIETGELEKLKGFGKKTIENLLVGIDYLQANQGRFLVNVANQTAQIWMEYLVRCEDIQQLQIAGSLRRKKETVKDIDILCTSQKPVAVMNYFLSCPWIERVLVQGDTKSSVVSKNGMQIDLRVVSETEYPFALLHFTGSKEHNTILRGLAKEKDLKLNEYGLFSGETSLVCRSEEEIYQALGLHLVPPPLREGRKEVQQAKLQAFPKLIAHSDLQGILHCHTLYSDGASTVAEMAEASQKLGMKYLGITDHSRSAFYAQGLEIPTVQKQWREMEEWNQQNDSFVLLKGIESDILEDGSLDYPDEILKGFDFIIASVHSRFQMDSKSMTARIVRAIENPYTSILGHMTGRLLLKRKGYEIDVLQIIDACAANKVAIEINSNPWRLDIDWRWIEKCVEKGVKMCVCPDAHNVEGLQDTLYGVGIAQKGGLTREHIINTYDVETIRSFFSKGKTISV